MSQHADGPKLRVRGEELAVAAPASASGRDGVMASPPPPRQQWLLEGAVAAFHHVLTISTRSRMYDQAEHWTLRSLLTTLALDVRGSLSVVSRVNLRGIPQHRTRRRPLNHVAYDAPTVDMVYL